MLTAKEQWRILQKEEKKRGGGRRKKAFLEQLEDMGAFGHDPDSEQAIRADLERTDTRPRLQYSQKSISQSEVAFGGSSFWKSRRRLFKSWVFEAQRSTGWMEVKDLPLFFRFALRRPIMDERSFQATLQALNMELKIPMGDARQPYTQPIGRSRQLMFGINVDQEQKGHVSSRFRDVLPRGADVNMDIVREEASRVVQEDDEDDEDMQDLIRRQLWTVYEHVQDGSVPLETATWHYRDALDIQDMSDETLVIWLQRFDIPTDHIPNNERNARRGSSHYPSTSGSESFNEEIENVAVAVAKEAEREIINNLANYVRFYRDGALLEHEVITMIQHRLDGLKLDGQDISDILNDLDNSDESAAELIWEDMVYNRNQSSSDKDEGSHEEQKNPYRAVIVPDPHVNEGTSPDDAAVSLADGSNSHDRPVTKDMDDRDDFKENELEESEATSTDRPPVSPPEVPPGKRSTSSHEMEAESKVQPPPTPRPKHASLSPVTEESGSQADAESDRGSSQDRANVGRRRPSSPDNGMTTGIWGLLMRTKEARKLAQEMKLPQHTIDDQVRSISPRRTKERRASYAKTIVTFPKSKRKASIVLHGDKPLKSPRHGDHSDLFAREGEDQETFLLSHFGRDTIPSDDLCIRCRRLPCECVYGSPPRSRSEPECPTCSQRPCICGRLDHLDEAIPITHPNADVSFDSLEVELADTIRPRRPKQSGTLLAYLTRVLDEDDVLAQIKELERLPSAETRMANVKSILAHVKQGLDAGEKLDATGTDDREALRILQALIQSSQTLVDYSHELVTDTRGETTSATSIDACDEGVEEGPDVAPSLLDSSLGQEHVSTPPSNLVASAPASPETQSNVANRSVFRANNTPLAKGISHDLPTPAPDCGVPRFESSSDIEDVVQPSRFQAGIFPESLSGGDSSRAENHSDSPARRESSTARGHPSGAETQSPPSSTAGLSEQVSEHSIDAEGDTDCDNLGAPLMRQPNSNSYNKSNREVQTQLAPSLEPGVKQLPTSVPPPSLELSLKELPKSTPPATPEIESKEQLKTMNATAQSCLKSPGFGSLPPWPPQPEVPGKAGMVWKGLVPEKALEHAKEEAFKQRKSLAFYLEERRAVRTRIKKGIDFANSISSAHSFFQSSNGLSGSSGTGTTPTLNKLFDKYRGTSDSNLSPIP